MCTQDSLLSLFKSLGLRRLTHVRICMYTDIPLHVQRRRISRPVYNALRSFQFDRLLTALPTILPSLSYIFITANGYANGEASQRERKVNRAWRVRRPSAGSQSAEVEGGTHDLEELPAGETELMLDREEMHPTRRRLVCLTFCFTVDSLKMTFTIVGHGERIIRRVRLGRQRGQRRRSSGLRS